MINKVVEILNQNDVLSLKEWKYSLEIKHGTFKVNEFIYRVLASTGHTVAKEWCLDGVDSEVLVEGKGWRTGKVRLTMEFYPDEPESLLDDIRRAIDSNNS